MTSGGQFMYQTILSILTFIDNRNRVDSCVDFNLPETKIPEPSDSRNFALERVLKHREAIIRVNPIEDEKIDQALRAAMTYMMTGKISYIPKGIVVTVVEIHRVASGNKYIFSHK